MITGSVRGAARSGRIRAEAVIMGRASLRSATGSAAPRGVRRIIHLVNDATAAPDDLALLRAYEPVVRYTEGELFRPTAVGPYVRRCGLWAHELGTPPETAELIVAPGGLSLDALAAAGRERGDRSLELRFVERPLRGKAMRAWRRQERPRLRGAARLAAVGVLARTIDSLLRLSLLLRGRTPGGMAAAAEVASREHLDPDRPVYHGRVVRDGGYIVLQYWLFYVFNDWRSTFSGINDHEADWELVTVYLADEPQGPVPRWVAASCHDHTGDELRRHWDDPRLRREGDHPVIFAGAGSHAGMFEPDDVVVSVELPALRRAVVAAAGVWGLLAPWSRWSPPPGAFGLPFLDYARGDGLAVGPGQSRPWDACVIAEGTPWVRDYRGLWGLDTHDVFGGERAPAGPRYERGGAVRASWADPLGWAGLQKEAPTDAAEAEHLARRVLEQTERLRELDEAIAAGRDALRDLAAELRSLDGRANRRTAARRGELARRERELAAACATRAEVADELAVHRERLAGPARPAGDASLRPSAPAARPPGRPRMLRVWAALSTPLLVLTVVVLLLGPPLAFLTSLVLVVLLFFGVEATARGRLLRFVVGLVLLGLTVAVVAGVVIGLVQNWRIVLAVLLSLLALVLVIVNVRELRR